MPTPSHNEAVINLRRDDQDEGGEDDEDEEQTHALEAVLTGIEARHRNGDHVLVSVAKRIGVTLQIAMIELFLTAVSGTDATVIPQAAKALGASEAAQSSCHSLDKMSASLLYAITAFVGPMVGAMIGACIGPSESVSWRWAERSMLISSGLVLAIVCLLMLETYGPLLLQWKAAHYRAMTGDDRFRCEHEIGDATLFSRLRISMTRPFVMITEPIIVAMACYITAVYAVLFTFLIGWPYLFERMYGIHQGLSNIIFLSALVGITGIFLCVYMYIIDSYEIYSASALTFVALIRYVVAGEMTVVGIPFYENMGTCSIP
ncbi:Major Facilitator Superfamily [Geosmithia morbida]|uniref:Major Facilitator Superfamily n=1 Tax=Geosmithia morbida TaxID=1094350 RepID=A0A9P4Z3E5_9HYPO|nr:Major Facilitator Superfamily [Geosmithia morbida]KAF4125909.1 Major Facilitator Superfamily [Geosmithia morbida]